MKRKITQVGVQIPTNTQNSNITLSDEEAETLIDVLVLSLLLDTQSKVGNWVEVG